jgi:hypothetical protein
MPWRVGLDEAGYGPNLGPLVVASTACHVPDGNPKCLWTRLARTVRRREDSDDGRLLIDDSKKVNEGPTGLAKLEAGVLAALSAARPSLPATVLAYLESVAVGDSLDDMRAEPWFEPEDPLPVTDGAGTEVASTIADESVSKKVQWGPIRSVIVPTPRFNRLLDEWRVKSGVVASAVIALLRMTLDLPGDDAIHVNVDKLGGRHFYAPLLNEAYPGGWVRTIREGPNCCDYEIDGLSRPVSVRFEPRADGTHLNVALASMAAKYLREVCMRQFNRYWLAKVPGLAPTAGYPGDASRFYEAIRGVLATDGVDGRLVWRER